MPGTSKCSPALRACEWQHSALHGASMHRSHPQSGGDLALGCEPESKGIADISVSCDGLFDVGSAGVRPGAFIHAVARALATLAPSSWPTASEIVRLASRVFPECPVAAAVSFLIWGRIEGGARCAQTDASWFGARWGDLYQHVGDDTGLGRMVRLRLPRLRLLRSARVQPYVQLRLHPASLSRFSAGRTSTAHPSIVRAYGDGARGVDGIGAGADDDIGDGATAGADDIGGGVGRVPLSCLPEA